MQVIALSGMAAQDSVLATQQAALARALASIEPDVTVRLEARGQRSEGVLKSTNLDSVFLVHRGVVEGTPRRSIDGLWVRQSATGPAAGIGALAGAVIFGCGAVALVSDVTTQRQKTSGGRPGAFLVGAGVGAVVGGVLGAGAGAILHYWSRRYP
jgi:hypothetical protein